MHTLYVYMYIFSYSHTIFVCKISYVYTKYLHTYKNISMFFNKNNFAYYKIESILNYYLLKKK